MLLAIGDFLRFLVVALFFLLLFFIGLLVGTFVSDLIFSPPAANFTNVTYPTANGETRQAYLNIPSGGGPHPGIILIPDYWGVNDQMAHLTNVLGDAGFIVLTPDIYHGPTSHVIHRALLLGRQIPRSRVFADLDAAAAYLRQHNAVLADHIGVVGVGFGGGLALEYVAQNPQFEAVVDLYGPVATHLGEFDGALMGLFGSQDRLVRPNQAYQLLSMAEAAGLKSRVDILDGLDNGFMHYPDIILVGTAPNDAWNYMVEFLHGALDPIPPCRLIDLYYRGLWCG